MKGMIIAGTHSGCGKTTVTLGILAALKKKGLSVQAFKTGPDFIDTGLHELITGRTSRNLDIWMCGEDYVKECFRKHSADADIAVVEGVMGLYDGRYSTSVLASALDLPVILVVDAYGMAESAGAVVKGFAEYSAEARKRGSAEEDLRASELMSLRANFAGVIFNRVASENHCNRLKDSISDVPVIGHLPRDLDFEIPHRHLGLTVAEESPVTASNIQKLADVILENINVDSLVQKCKSEEVRKHVSTKARKRKTSPHPRIPASKLKIAVAYDKAFCFYYHDNLDLLRDAGAEILAFSPLEDKRIPNGADALYIGGGYPELYARELAGNRSLLESVRSGVYKGMPAYAECGGFMYLTEGIYDFEGAFYPMVGAFPLKTRMTNKRAKLGYRELTLREDSIIGRRGTTCRGHEFHYSEIVKSSIVPRSHSAKAGKRGSAKEQKYESDEARKCRSTEENGGRACELVYKLKDGNGNVLPDEGYRVKNTLGSYVHVHFGSNKDIARNFIDFSTNSKLVETRIDGSSCLNRSNRSNGNSKGALWK